MTQAQMTSTTASPSTWQMYRAMVGVGLICGLLIVTVYQVTKPRIERNKAEALQAAIFEVLPGTESRRTYRLAGEEGFEATEAPQADDALVYAGYDALGQLTGIAIEAAGMGYQDVIRLLYGYSPAEDAIVGFKVLEHKETPGLGDKIQTDEEFLGNFERLDATLVHPIEAVKHGKKEHPWQVDGITGATISSVAIGNILNQSTSHWIPLIERNLGDFSEAE